MTPDGKTAGMAVNVVCPGDIKTVTVSWPGAVIVSPTGDLYFPGAMGHGLYRLMPVDASEVSG